MAVDIDGVNSTVSTDKLIPQSGTALQIGESGDTVTLVGSAVGFGGLYASIAIICDQKAYDGEGGTLTSGAWRTRDLNTEISDADGIVSISSNRFTLGAGTYTVTWFAPHYRVDRVATRLYNYTDTAVTQYGSAHHTSVSVDTTDYGKAVFTITGSKVFEIQVRSSATHATYGLGIAANFDSAAVSIYTVVEILKHS
jgi:hypothetical protein